MSTRNFIICFSITNQAHKAVLDLKAKEERMELQEVLVKVVLLDLRVREANPVSKEDRVSVVSKVPLETLDLVDSQDCLDLKVS